MADFLETPVREFEWGPAERLRDRVHEHWPAAAIGAGFVLDVTGFVWLFHG